MDDLISRRAAIVALVFSDDTGDMTCGQMAKVLDVIKALPSAQPELYQEKLKEIADALSEKFAYMHTCLNERDLILGYLGVKHSNEIHCNTDCTNAICESYHFDKRLPSAQPEIIRCKDCKHRIVNEHAGEKGYLNLKAMCELDSGDPFELGRCAEDDEWFCADAERREDETDKP